MKRKYSRDFFLSKDSNFQWPADFKGQLLDAAFFIAVGLICSGVSILSPDLRDVLVIAASCLSFYLIGTSLPGGALH